MKCSDSEQFEEVYNKYSDMLYRVALSHLLSSADAEDAVHDVFIKYMNGVFTFFSDEHEKSWFLRVMINHCHDTLRKRKLRTHAPLEDALAVFEENGTGEITREVLSLDEIYKTPVILHYYEGYRVEEIARILRISGSAVKMRLSRAREKLKLNISGEI